MSAAGDTGVSKTARSTAQGRKSQRLLGGGCTVLKGVAGRFPPARPLYGSADRRKAQVSGTGLARDEGSRRPVVPGQECRACGNLREEIGANLIDARKPMSHGKRQSIGLI